MTFVLLVLLTVAGVAAGRASGWEEIAKTAVLLIAIAIVLAGDLAGRSER